MAGKLAWWGEPRWVLHPKIAAYAAALGAEYSTLRADQNNGGTLFGIPAVVSINVPSTRILLIDASEILFADNGVSISMSDQATIEMETTPAVASSRHAN